MAVASLKDLTAPDLDAALRSGRLVLDLGAMQVRVKSEVSGFGANLRRLYPHFPYIDDQGWADTEVSLSNRLGGRSLLRRQVAVEADGIELFERFPRALATPVFEWGLNWCFAHMFNQHLLLHSGTLELSSVGMLLVAEPGSGKSTLTAALGANGARILSDEFGVVRREDLKLLPIPKPIALKNQSIAVIENWAPGSEIGPTFTKTRKGDIAHMAIPRQSVERRHEPATAKVVIFPRWSSGAKLTVEPVGAASAFMGLAMNSFNYSTLGPDGFDMVAALVERCRFFRLTYGKLSDAVPAINELCATIAAR